MLWNRTNRPVWLRCAVGVLAAIIAAAIRLQFFEILELRVTFLTFYPAVAVAALYGGLGPGLLATVVSAALADYFWMEPVGSFAIASSADLISMAVFLASGALISYVAEAAFSAQARARTIEVQAKLAVEQQFHLFVSEVKDYAIIMLDTAGCVVSWNMGAEQIKGYQADEIIGRSHSCFYTPEDNARGWPGQLLDRAASVARVEDEGWRVRKDGSRFWADVVVTALHDKGGSLRGFSKVTRDITERKRAEALLQRQAELLHISHDAIIVWQIDGGIETWNKGAEELYGYSKEEAVGQVTHDLLKTIHPKPWTNIETTLRERKSWEGELKHRTREGREVIVSARHQLVYGTDGVERVLETNRDITDRRQAEEDVRRQREWLRVTLTSIGDGVIATDASGLIIFINPVAEALTGWQVEEAVGLPVQRIFRIINEKTHEPLADIVEHVLREGIVVALANHSTLVSRDGREVPIEDSAAPIKDDTGKISGAVLVFHDVTERRRAREALRASEEHYRSLFDNMLNGYAYCKMHFEQDRPIDFTYLDVNGAFETLTGLKGVVGRKVSEVIPGIRQSDPELLELYGRVALTGIPERFETYVASLGMWFSISAYSLRKEHFVAVFDVITERKRTEESMRESEARFRALVQASSDVVYRMSPNWDQMHQLDGRDFISDTETPSNSWLQKYIHPDDQSLVRATINEAIRNKSIFELEHRVMRADGSLGWTFSRAVPLQDKNGEIVEWFGAASNITERKQMEEELRESQQKNEFLADIIRIGSQPFVVGYPDGRLGVVNSAFEHLTGYSSDELQSIDWAIDLTPAEWLPLERQKLEEQILTGKPIRYEKEYIRKDGSRVPIELLVHLVKDSDGRPQYYYSFLTDITERKQMEEELRNSRDDLELRVRERTAELKAYMAKIEQSNQALQDFASIAAHDMKEPLRKVIAFGSMLRQKYEDPLGETGNDYLNRMLGATERMQSLLAGLLDYSRVTTASKPFKEVDLSDIIGEVISDLEVRIVKTGGKVHIGSLPVISADPTQMRQLFQNLIGNALKFHKPGKKPTVRVSSECNEDSGCEIVVEDNGTGFDEQYREKIFAPFQRFHARSEYEGTGMGLAICKKIVERHGGSITAKSTPGAGSQFIVTLPVRSRMN
ncbi:MAG: PAS domain S-box protein [Syntrophobacteraceae bacterium]